MHLRAIVPADLCAAALEILERDGAVTEITVQPGAARRPAGDVIECAVPREAASALVEALQGLGVARRGSISLMDVDVSLSDAAETAERREPGLAEDVVVWEELEQRSGEETRLSGSYLVFMVVAAWIACVGVLNDQAILIVGAMVVGPDFGPLAALSVALVRRRRRDALRAALAVVVGFGTAIAATVVFALGLAAVGQGSAAMLLAERPNTAFIWQPDSLSVIVGMLAGIAGMLSLTSTKSGALVGVLISVTTIPAAADIAASLAYGLPGQAGGSAVQLVVNLVAIVLAGTGTLGVLRLLEARRRRRRQGAAA